MLLRVSRRLIKTHKYYILQLLHEKERDETNKIDENYYFQEFFIPTVGHMFNLTIFSYDHSNMDVYITALTEEDISKSLVNGKEIFHPVKHNSRLLINATRYSILKLLLYSDA